MTASPAPATGARRAFLSLASVFLGTLAAFLLGEAFCRVLGLKAKEPGRIFRISDGANVTFPGRAGHTVIDLYNSNPRGVFPVDLNDAATRQDLMRRKFTRVEEAWKTNPFGIAFTYNSRGFREREFTPKPPGARRVVFVGDSFTEGMGVQEGATAVKLVEKRLQREGHAIEAWNLGVRAYDFPDLERVFDIALELEPDVVILDMVLNDGARSEELEKRWPRANDWIMVRQAQPSWLERHSYFAAFAARRYEDLRVGQDTAAWYRALYSDQNRDGWMQTRASLQRMRAACKERGIAFGVALWPLLVGLEAGASYPFEAAHAQIRTGVERAGIPFLDLLPALRGQDSASLWVHPSDLHPNERAQALVSPVLADFVDLRLQNAPNRQSVAK
jgi:lysophospholipase L1-like esterase